MDSWSRSVAEEQKARMMGNRDQKLARAHRTERQEARGKRSRSFTCPCSQTSFRVELFGQQDARLDDGRPSCAGRQHGTDRRRSLSSKCCKGVPLFIIRVRPEDRTQLHAGLHLFARAGR